MEQQPAMTKQEIQEILDRVSFMDRKFRLLEKGDGYLLQMRYMENDVEDPDKGPVLQSTRKYYISPFMIEEEVVETAWLCVQRSMLHVASEHFTYKGRRIYSQHFSLSARIEACDMGEFNSRIVDECLVRLDSGVCERGTRGCIRHPARELSPDLLKAFHEKDSL